MTKQYNFWLIITVLTIFTAIVSVPIDIYPATASPKKPDRSISPADKLIFVFNSNNSPGRSTENRSGMRRTKVAGSRGCGTEIVALIPRSHLGVTISDRPTLWFYLGASNREVESIEFTVFPSHNPGDRTTWSAQILPKDRKLETGLLKVKYPGRALRAGNYEWEFNYQQAGCNKPQTLAGYLQKETNSQLASIDNSQQRWRSYAKNGIWHELLDELILGRQQPPQSQFITDLRSLFFESKDVNYTLATDENSIDRDLSEKIVTANVIKCCELVKIK
ncbi:DUF928 domain-containing protein [Chamaesiphon sp. VAR_69_metabat_338]|uniref:DUF928 domain-containing protein n=1 Tax=Chamaesiphon sp. VAR_69_metabat_338 TaxID=2964704 RepID=UPI00286EAD56|nr:DUF928 domain-containing protein [Chamaesiphon sp. VAR_69_metabat_338]